MIKCLPHPDATFDNVISTWVLEHLEDLNSLFSEIRTVLKPGGRFIFLRAESFTYISYRTNLSKDCFSIQFAYMVKAWYCRYS